jgi:hypothetical protein
MSTPETAPWNSEQEELIAGIGDRCNGYQWLHTQCQIRFEHWDFWLTIPSIGITAVTGSVTIGLNSLFPPEHQTTATTVLGALTIGTGILTTFNQYMKSAQLVEAHKAAALAYGKLYRTILTELSLHRSSRSNPIAFLKMIRSEQDRLQETSPTVLPHIIAAFNARFKENTHLQKPEITGDLDHIVIPLLGPHTPSEPPSPTTTPVALDIRGDAPSAIAIAIESPDVTTGAAKRASSAVVSTRMPSPNESL